MRADFSADLQKKMEENSVFKKATIRVLALSLTSGFILCVVLFNFFQKFISNLPSQDLIYLILVVLFSVLLGGICALVVFLNILMHLKRVINELSNDKPRWDWLESEYIESDIHDTYLAIKKLHKDVSSHAKMVGIAEMASQVAHDIRSPLTALDFVVNGLSGLSEEHSHLLRNAMGRIKDMVANLLPSNIDNRNTSSEDDGLNSELILQVLIDIVSEKKYEHRNTRIKISLHIDEKSCDAFSKIGRHQFQRIISNIINNSIDSFVSIGNIDLFFRKNEEFIEIVVSDNGCGIPNDILPKIKHSVFTYNKIDGHGLGLYHASEYLSTIGGELLIKSEVNEGTVVTIRLPAANTPAWFAKGFCIKPSSKVVVLGEANCHSIAHSVFLKMKSDYSGLDVSNYLTHSELMKSTVILDEIDFLLVDHNSNISNTSVINFLIENKLSSRSLLITSNHIEKELQCILIENKITVFPKKLIRFIKDDFFHYNSHYVLIDDSQIVIDTWKLRSLEKNISFNGFTKINEFLEFISKIDKNTNIYIDFNLNCEINGDELAKDLYSKGFDSLYLCTGYEKDEFQPIHYIKDVVGKEPPF